MVLSRPPVPSKLGEDYSGRPRRADDYCGLAVVLTRGSRRTTSFTYKVHYVYKVVKEVFS